MTYDLILLAGALTGALCLPAAAAPVELPPEPKIKVPSPKEWWAPGTRMPAYVIQTSTGLVECPNRFYEAQVCRPYVQGRDKRMRAFVRKDGDWMVCPRSTGRDGCVGIRELPNMIEQD
jgi:hypothetical protein